MAEANDTLCPLVRSAAYVDALVQEQRDTDANGSLDRTLYATHDANFNVTAAVTLGGIAQQRFLYDAYGARSVLAFDWQPTTNAPRTHRSHAETPRRGGKGPRGEGTESSQVRRVPYLCVSAPLRESDPRVRTAYRPHNAA